MVETISRTNERIMPEKFKSEEEYLLYLRHLFAYEFARDKIQKNSFVLEVGCGEGYGTHLLSQQSQHNVRIVGLDNDKSIISHASNKYGSENCIFTAYDGVKIPFEDAAFDVVISFQVIEHIQDDKNFVAELYRVLKQNGFCILTTPNRTYRVEPGHKPWNRFHIREYTPDDFSVILKNKFLHVNVWGIRGSDELQRKEMERVNMIKGSILRKMIPEPLKSVLSKILERISCGMAERNNDAYLFKAYNQSDYYLIKSNVEESLDLLAICNK